MVSMELPSAGKILDTFYNDYPVPKNSHVALAKAYIGRFVRRGGLQHILDISPGQQYVSPLHLSLASYDFDISSLTKRASLVGEPLIVSSLRTSSYDGEYACSESGDPIELYGISLESLGSWLASCEPLVRQGRLIFYPDLTRVQFSAEDSDSPYDRMTEYAETSDHITLTRMELFHIVDRNRRIIASESVRQTAALNMVKPLLVTEIPILEGASLGDYCRLAVEEFPTQFDALREHLRLQLIDDLPDEGAVIDAALTLQIEINSAVRQLESDLRLGMRKAAVEVTGASMATVTATLFAITGNSFVVEAESILGASGGLWGVLHGTDNYLSARQAARNSPYYFMWALGRPRKRN
jgi:hypothetical protein